MIVTRHTKRVWLLDILRTNQLMDTQLADKLYACK